MSNRSFSRVMLVGIFLIALANVASYMMQRHSSLSESVTDPIIGFLYGVAIATTLLAVWKQARRPRTRCS